MPTPFFLLPSLFPFPSLPSREKFQQEKLFLHGVFLGIKTKRELKKMSFGAMAAEVLNRMRPRTCQSD